MTPVPPGAARWFHPDRAALRPEVVAAFEDGAGIPAYAPADLVERAMSRLRPVFRTIEPVVVFPGPARILREISLHAAVEHRALVVVAGPEGEALADTVEAIGREVIRVAVHRGRVLEPEHLERFLEGPEVDTVALVHAERGTGARLPLAELARVVRRRRDVLLFVDAAATLGASPVETDAWGLDLVVTAGEGPLALPAGLGLACVSPRLRARAQRLRARGRELDLVAYCRAADSRRSLLPLPLGLTAALDRQLDRILAGDGMAGRWDRHRQLREMMDRWETEQAGVAIVARPDCRAASLSCLELPGIGSTAAIVGALAEEGYTVAPGLGVEADRMLRIGHMGEAEPEQLEGLLGALGRKLEGGRS